jgi:lysophospholipase L1-like esterase
VYVRAEREQRPEPEPTYERHAIEPASDDAPQLVRRAQPDAEPAASPTLVRASDRTGTPASDRLSELANPDAETLARAQRLTLGEAMQIKLARAVAGLGDVGDIVTVTHTAYIDALITYGHAAQYTAPVPYRVKLDPTIKQGIMNAMGSKLWRGAGWPGLRSTVVHPQVTAAVAAAAALAQATVNVGVAAAGALIPANLALFDFGPESGAVSVSSNVWTYHALPSRYGEKMIRFYTDSQYVSVALYYGIQGGARVWVDGQPVNAVNSFLMGGANVYLNLTFSSSLARLIEVKTDNMFAGVQVAPLAQVWAPAPLSAAGPRVLCVGDSFTQGYYATGGLGAYQVVMDQYLDAAWFGTDGQGGSGYVSKGSYTANYVDRAANHIAVAPDLVLVGGGGANDFYQSHTQTEVQAAVQAYFQQLRGALPDAKLVFVEGLLPPLFRNAGVGAQYDTLNAAIDGGLLAGLNVDRIRGCGTWLTGTGYQGHVIGDGNSDRYIFTDATHPNDAGHQYIGRRLAEQLIPILEAA